MKRLSTYLLLLFFVSNQSNILSQTKTIDSLLKCLNDAKTDTNAVKLHNQLSWEFDGQGELTKAIKYGEEALALSKKINFINGEIESCNNIGNAYADEGENKKALTYYTTALQLNLNANKKKNIAQSYNLIGIIYYNLGNYDSALINYTSALILNKEIDNKIGIAKNYNNVSIIFEKKGNYPKALDGYKKGLDIAIQLGDKNLISNEYLNIGDCYRLQGNFEEALKNQLASLKINEQIHNKEGIAGNYSNMALIYKEQENYTEALKNNFASLKINSSLKNKNLIAINYINIGLIYYAQGDYSSALTSQLASLKLNNELKDKVYIAINIANIGRIHEAQNKFTDALKNYFDAMKIMDELGDKQGIANSCINIGTVFTKQKKYEEAIQYLNKGLNLSKAIGNKDRVKESYNALSLLDSAQGKWKNAYIHNRMYYVYRDSLVNELNTKKLVQTQMNYEFGKKQDAEKLEQLKKDAIADEEKQKQKWITISIGLGLLIVLIFSVLLTNRFRITVKQKQVIEVQKKEVEIQKEIIERKNKEVTDSINYAKRIQTAILPSSRIVKEILPKSFVLYIPKDIVAGDFYWLETKITNTEHIFFAACDCTGHGVSGAMVSVVCNNALNRAVREFDLIEPSEILDKVDTIVIESFSKSESEIMDGMDASLCCYNPSTKQLHWAGANNPIYIIRNNEIIETKGDKRPIGGKYRNTNPFTNHTFQLVDGDRIYLFSDGFADQFGGENGRKKLTRKRFKDLILSIQNISIDKHNVALEDFFESFHNGVEQIDDVLVLGMEV